MAMMPPLHLPVPPAHPSSRAPVTIPRIPKLLVSHILINPVHRLTRPVELLISTTIGRSKLVDIGHTTL